MIIVLLADGFEEIEALTPVDMLRRAGINVKTVGISGKLAVGSHGIAVECDLIADEVNISEVSGAIFPGGMPGSLNLDASPFTDKVIEEVTKKGGRLAAICAAPLVFGRRGLLTGKRATCYPGFEKELVGAEVTGEDVVTDGIFTTAKGMGVSLAFAKELVSLLCSPDKARELSAGIMESKTEKAECNEKVQDDTSYASDKLFLEAVRLTLTSGNASTALIQRKLSIGYGKAARFIDLMESLGIVSKFKGANEPRKILTTQEKWEQKLKQIN